MEQAATKRVVRRIASPDLFNMPQHTAAKKLVVAAYARVSTEKEQQENSYERQVEHYTALIKANEEWEFGGVYADPGISGTRAEKRPEFMRMIQDCREGKIQKILAKSISRFARNTVDTLSYIRELKELDVGVYFENENIDTLTPGGEVLLTILAAIAEQESRTISTNIKWTYQKKFQNGEVILNTANTLGYQKGADGAYVINEAEAEIVRRIFREYIAGISLPQICRGLETAGYTTKRGSTKWRTNAVLGILRNEKYTGNAILGKTYKPDVLSKRRYKNTGQAPLYYVENTHPAIISQEIFDLAQAEMQRRLDEKDTAAGHSRYTSKYPFSGLLVCGVCGHKLRRHVRTVGSGKQVAAWGCTNRIQNGRCVCDSRHVNEDVLERTYRAAMVDAMSSIGTVKGALNDTMINDSAAELYKVNDEILQIQEAVLNLHRSMQQEAVSDVVYEREIDRYSKQMAILQDRQKELRSQANQYAEAKHWLEAFEQHTLSGEAFNTDDAVVMREMVEQIVVYEDRIEIHPRCGAHSAIRLINEP